MVFKNKISLNNRNLNKKKIYLKIKLKIKNHSFHTMKTFETIYHK